VDRARIHITECPRDAMQGIKDFIPTHLKVEYLNALLNCGFDRLDFGSFVSPKAIPQLVDTSEVVGQLIKTLSDTNKDLLDLGKKVKDLKSKKDDTQQPQHVTNALFVGSTAELQKLIGKR